MIKRIDYHKIAPDGAKPLAGVYNYIKQTDIAEELVELVYLRISQINNCAYCLDSHTRALVKKVFQLKSLHLCRHGRSVRHFLAIVNVRHLHGLKV